MMSIKPPRAARPSRNTVRWREFATVGLVSLLLILFVLRALLALLDIHTWTAAWRVVAIPTTVVIVPLQQLSILERTLVGRLMIAELLAALVVSVVAIIVLSSLANKRR